MKRLLLCFLILILPACGKKGPLIPPEALAPAAITNLAVSQKGEGLFVSWSAPDKDAGGRPLKDLAGFRIFARDVLPPEQDCEECPNAYRLRATLDLEFLTGAFRYDDRYFFIDQGLKLGNTYQYKVVSFQKDGTESAPSNKIRRKVVLSPAPPTISAVSTPTSIVVQWQPVATLPGSTVVGYLVYRKRAEDSFFPPVPSTPSPVTGTKYEDIGLERGVTYVYGVRTVVTEEKENVESKLSNEASALLPQSQE